MTIEDIKILQGVVNSITFVRGGLNVSESEQRDLLNQSLIPLRTLILAGVEVRPLSQFGVI